MSSDGTHESVADVGTIGILHPCILKNRSPAVQISVPFVKDPKADRASGLVGSLDAGVRP
ncbi:MULTISPECIES: hypothetical protein [Rhizobium]|jgi:hypothetical protein|uniref:Uncharacterized protein n=1 Tax=Rhizobium tropici TaxID=398 RepID=A0A329YL34_RHITR|nr:MULTISPECIES: hypothetical protein [Rhizobium]MBB3290970.1 hypothetical protein [Rhizobium sp. BK252]MBB3405725.1 hypothetical protein [Rhizobium sp. BK289]MBB3418273.1 hypothetical protein [Rhizobium sp. BK284]RAX43234.1 hypothetical protein DQ393_02150 [Rhizobium tropici]